MSKADKMFLKLGYEIEEEDYEGVEILESWKNYNIKNKNKLLKADEIIEVQETILTLISKLQKENELKDKVIDEMANYIEGLDIDEDICKNISFAECIADEEYTNCADCVKQYFINKVKGEEDVSS